MSTDPAYGGKWLRPPATQDEAQMKIPLTIRELLWMYFGCAMIGLGLGSVKIALGIALIIMTLTKYGSRD